MGSVEVELNETYGSLNEGFTFKANWSELFTYNQLVEGKWYIKVLVNDLPYYISEDVIIELSERI